MANRIESSLEGFVFWSRWLQAPLYVGLIGAQVLYCYKFATEFWHLLVHPLATSSQQLFMLGVLELIDITMVANLITMVVIGGYATFVSKLDLEGHTDRPDWLAHIDPGAIKVKLAGSLIGVSAVHLLQSFITLDQLTDQVNAAATRLNDANLALAKAATSEAVEHAKSIAAQFTEALRVARDAMTVNSDRIKWQIVIHVTFLFSTILLALTELVMHRRHRAGEGHGGSSGVHPATPRPVDHAAGH